MGALFDLILSYVCSSTIVKEFVAGIALKVVIQLFNSHRALDPVFKAQSEAAYALWDASKTDEEESDALAAIHALIPASK